MLDRDTWLDQGQQLAKQHQRNGQWVIGDWLTQFPWGRKYEHAAEIFGLSPGTLKNYASICKKFEPSRRRDGLSFEHHAAVAALDNPDEQDRLLRRAEDERLTARALRAVAHSDKPAQRILTLEVPETTYRLWESVAPDARVPQWLFELATTNAVLARGPSVAAAA